jgi:hypothetical protein
MTEFSTETFGLTTIVYQQSTELEDDSMENLVELRCSRSARISDSCQILPTRRRREA